MKCNQLMCENEAAFRFTWPGSDEAGICDDHVDKLRSVANAMGMYIQIIPLNEHKKSAITIEK